MNLYNFPAWLSVFKDKGMTRSSFSKEYKTNATMEKAMKGYEAKGWKVTAYLAGTYIIIYQTK